MRRASFARTTKSARMIAYGGVSMRTRLWSWQAGLVLLVGSLHGGDDSNVVRRRQIEVLYTMHTSVDTDAKLERIRALVMRAYTNAEFAEASAEDRRMYYAMHRDRLLRVVGASPPAGDDAARHEWLMTRGYELAKAQVDREVTLRSIYQFLHAQAKDDQSLKTTFDRLKEKDDPKNPVCGTEPGKTPVVYRDFGGRKLTVQELTEVEDSGVKFGPSFKNRVVGMGDTGIPRKGPKADGLGAEWEGRQIFRLVAVTTDPPSVPSDSPNSR